MNIFISSFIKFYQSPFNDCVFKIVGGALGVMDIYTIHNTYNTMGDYANILYLAVLPGIGLFVLPYQFMIAKTWFISVPLLAFLSHKTKKNQFICPRLQESL